MFSDEIEVPKELREFMLDGAKETILGQKNGAKKQFRYGNLHIREYDDKFLVHNDEIDPRVNPIGHLICDSPEVLIGLASAFFGGKVISKKINNPSLATILASSIIFGYVGYTASKKLKHYLN
jgi:hypothetical protein